MKSFERKVNDFWPITDVEKVSILDIYGFLDTSYLYTVFVKTESFRVIKNIDLLYLNDIYFDFSGSSDFSQSYFLISFRAGETKHNEFIIAVDEDLPEVCSFL